MTFFFFFFVVGVLAVSPPFFARCPIFRNQSCHIENQTEPASQIPEELGVKHPIPRVEKGVPGFGIERAPSREGVRRASPPGALDHQATPAALKMTHQTKYMPVAVL
jgi:hypothetical protein